MLKSDCPVACGFLFWCVVVCWVNVDVWVWSRCLGLLIFDDEWVGFVFCALLLCSLDFVVCCVLVVFPYRIAF